MSWTRASHWEVISPCQELQLQQGDLSVKDLELFCFLSAAVIKLYAQTQLR